MPSATATETVTFIAKCHNQVLTRRQARHVEDGMGGKVLQGEAEWLEAQSRKNEERELSGLEPLSIDDAPWKVEFQNHIFSTENETLIEWLRGHRLFNAKAGFWEQGAPPDEPRPTMTEQQVRIAEASAIADIEGVEKTLQIEKDTHNRVPIIQAAEAALRRLRELDLEPGADASTDNNGGSSSTSPPSPSD